MTEARGAAADPNPAPPQVAGEGPALAELLRWMAELPPSMRLGGAGAAVDEAVVPAVLQDVLETLTGDDAMRDIVTLYAQHADRGTAAMRRTWTLQAGWALRLCWALWHPEVRSKGGGGQVARLRKLILQDLPQLAAIVPLGHLDSEPERREELVRRALLALQLRPAGESHREAEARLAEVDSISAHLIAKEADARERRAREVREAAARKAAEEAAAKVSRE